MRVLFIIFFLTFTLFAQDCSSKLFTIKSKAGVSLRSYVDSLSAECSLSVVYKDALIQEKLESIKLGKMNLKNVSLYELLDILFHENNIEYTLDGNILKLNYVITKTFQLDYVNTKRLGKTVTDASVDVGIQNSGTGNTASTNNSASVSHSGDVNSITAEDTFDFWENVQKELHAILNRPGDAYKAPEPVVNRQAGLVTVTGTYNQIRRIEQYIHSIQDRLHKEVMIDVAILAVFLDEEATTGVDWSRFSLLINGAYNDIGKFEPGDPMVQFTRSGSGNGIDRMEVHNSITTIINSTLNLSAIIDFLQKNGKVVTLSNPKILTLNNQPAMISIGDTINYNVPTTVTIGAQGSLGTQAYQPSSIFVGILLNITPEITENNEVILRINPSISELKNIEDYNTNSSSGFREIAPDTKEKKISTVVKVKDGSTLILGGLISNTKNFTINGVPVLKDVPLFGNLFKSTKRANQRFELVFVLRTKIVDDGSSILGLEDLGFDQLVNVQK